MKALRFRTLLIWYSTAITLFLTVAVIVLYSSLFRKHAVDSLTGYGKSLAMNVAFSVADDLITENYAPLQQYVAELASRGNVDALEIADSTLTILAASDLTLLGTEMEGGPPGLSTQQDRRVSVAINDATKQVVVTAPIVVGETVLGRTRIFLTMKPILAHLHTIQRNAALTGLAFWVLAMLFATLLAQKTSETVQRFMAAADSITAGNLKVEIPSPRWVLELERFAKALRTMASTIASRELALLNSEKKYRHLFERAMDGIFVADDSGRLLDVNPAFMAILGEECRESALGRNLFGSIFENEQSFLAFKGAIAARGFVRDYELTLLRNDSTPVIVSLTCHAVATLGGEVGRYEGMIRDITAQKKAAMEIAQMRNYLNNIIESMPSMLVTLDHDSVVTQWNSAASEITGIPSTQAIGRKIYEIAPLFSKYRGQVDATSQDRKPIRLHREALDGHADHFYNLTFFPLVANGCSGVAIRLDDVTELEKKEQQLRQAQKMESVGTLAGGLAHDFNNVLAAILGNLSLLQFKMAKQQDALPLQVIRDHLAKMETAGQRAVEMVRQLLTLSRKQQADLVPVDLNLSVKHVRKIGENTFDKSVRMEVQQAAGPAYVLANPTEVEQVLLNLCINAVHAMTIMRADASAWGGLLTMAIDEVSADALFCSRHPEAVDTPYWRISVTDTGIGMDAQTVAKIFDPFFTTKEQGKGTGLGLAMVYNIVRQYHGFIDVYSESGAGSTFSVYLPRLMRPVEAAEPREKTAIATGEGLILVVDDDEIVRGMAEEVLGLVGYSVLSAANGQEAVALYRQHHDRIKAVLLDMAMPVMSGREAFLEMKQINPEVRVLLASGFRKDNRVEEILALGVKGFLQKPYTMEALALAIKHAIEA